jgi:hypothetical protein
MNSLTLLNMCFILVANLPNQFSLELCENKTGKYFVLKEDPYLKEKNLTISYFQNFNKFTDLKMNCNQTFNTTSSIQFRPNKKIVLNVNFSFAHLISLSSLRVLDTLCFSNIKGIDLNAKIVKRNMVHLSFIYSEFNAFSNGTLLSECDQNAYRKDHTNLMDTFRTIYFRQVIYPPSICSLLFRNSSVVHIFFTDITNSLLVKNRLKFVDSFNLIKVEMTRLMTVYFELNYESLTLDQLNFNLFKYTRSLILVGILSNIDTELFAPFSSLKTIQFKLNNLNEFFHQGNKWMTFLNNHINVNLTDKHEIQRLIKLEKILVLSIFHMKAFQSFIDFYAYPNEDLCLFKDFPHSHLVYPFVFPENKIKCTCTLKWLHLNVFNLRIIKHALDDVYFNGENSSNVFYYCDKDFDKLECDFKEMFSKCTFSIQNSAPNGIRNDVDLFYFIKWLEYILVLILQPLLCSWAILTNLLVILVIRNSKNHKELKSKMYKYAQINACFNIGYSSLMLFKLINTCVFYFSHVYKCSSVYQEGFSQYFKIYAVYFLGNVFKCCSNISYIFFSMSRYIAISLDSKNRFFIRFKRINVKAFVFIVLCLGVLLSTFILFQYETNEVYDYRKSFPFEKRDGQFCLDERNTFSCRLFNTFKLVNQSFNGFLFLTLNLIIDIYLVYTFRDEMRQKSLLEFNKAKCEEFKKKTEKVTKMVLINSLVYFVSHAPIFVTTILLIAYAKRMAIFCTERMSCDLINEEADVFILVSMILNFFIFLFFNRHFDESFQEVKTKLYKIIGLTKKG